MRRQRTEELNRSAREYTARMRREGRTTESGLRYLLQRKIARVKSRSREAGIECNLKVHDIQFPDECPVLGIPLDYSTLDNTPSVDRIDQRGAYTKENVRVISMRANTLRGNGSTLEHLEIAMDSVRLEHGEEKARECAEAVKKILGLV